MAPLSTRGFNSGTMRSGGIRWAPDLSKFASVIKDLRDPIYDEAYKRLAPFPNAMLQYARANHKWRNRTGLAEHNLQARRRRGASYLSLSLGHSPHTEVDGFNYGQALETFVYENSISGDESEEDLAWMKANIKGFEDGPGRTSGYNEKIGESPDGHGTYAIVVPTIEVFGPEILPAMKGILEAAVRKQL